ncbi:TPA: 30S ribosomal protein S20 [Candidatus Gracilibacteria bacterium]|nr:30S ribosomal protein S20 [Candidatus Gracilibacteria bacterium]
MPNTSSAKKALKQSQTKASRNRRFSALYKETLKAFQKSLASGATDGLEILAKLYSRIDTLVKKNILHINNGSRKKSRFAKMLKAVSVKS